MNRVFSFEKKSAKQYKLYLSFLIVIFVFLVIRAHISFCWSDESLYVANLHRLFLGDSFIRDEYNGCMLSTYIILPLYSVYVWITGGTTGVYLFFRLITLCIQFIVCLDIFFYFCKRDKAFVGLCSSVFILIYTRANISGPSYYSFCFILFTWSVICFRRRKYFFTGILYGLSVIENPYLVIAVFYYLFLLITKKIKLKKDVPLLFAGGVISVIYFLCLFFHNISLSELLEYIPVWKQSLDAAGINRFVIDFFLSFPIYFGIRKMTLWFLLFIVGIAASGLYFHRKDAIKNKKIVVAVGIVYEFMCLLLAGLFMYRAKNTLGGAYIALGLWAILQFPFVIQKLGKVEKSELIDFGMFGLLLAVAFFLASNNGMDAVGIGFALFMIAVCIEADVIINSCLELKNVFWKICCISIVGSLLLAAFAMTFFLRIFAVYRDGTLNECTERLSGGPAAGLYTTQEHARQYRDVCQTVDQYINCDHTQTEKQTLLVTKLAPWIYLYADTLCDSPTLWRISLDANNAEVFYSDERHELPDYCLVLAPEYGNFQDNYIATWGENGDMTPNTNAKSGWLYDQLQGMEYEKIEVDCGVLYRKK